MDINVVTRVPYPIDQVFDAMRNRMTDLVAYMPNIDRIEVLEEKETAPGIIQMLNKWHAARTEIPAMARPFVDQSRMFWHDHATWNENEKLCNWKLEIGFMAERVDCGGTTSYHADGDATEMRIKGRLQLDLKGLVPRLMLRKATSGVESFIGKLIEPNFQKTADALTAYLDEQAKT